MQPGCFNELCRQQSIRNRLALCCTVDRAEAHRCSGPWQHTSAHAQFRRRAKRPPHRPPKSHLRMRSTVCFHMPCACAASARRSPLVLALGALDSTLALLRFEQLFAPLVEAILPASLHDGVALRSKGGSSGVGHLHRSDRNHHCRNTQQAPTQCSSIHHSFALASHHQPCPCMSLL